MAKVFEIPAVRASGTVVARKILAPLLEEIPGSVAQAYAICGGLVEARLLEAHRERTTGWQRKEIDKAIRAIRKRHDSVSKR